MMQKRTWIRSGIVEELDIRQQRLLALVLERIRHFYRELYRTRLCYQHPLNLRRLAKMCRRNNAAVLGAVRILANTVAEGQAEPEVTYARGRSERNKSHRPYQIFLRTTFLQ